jgi:hypothetical protein
MNAMKNLVLCGTVTKMTAHKRAWMAPRLVNLEVTSEEGYEQTFDLLAADCSAAEVGDYVRVKRFDIQPAGQRYMAFTAPAPKPVVMSRGYLLRIEGNTARIRLDDSSVVLMRVGQLKAGVVEGCAVRVTKFVHGWLEQYIEHRVERDTARPAWAGIHRGAVIHNTPMGAGIERFADAEIAAA